MRKLIGYFCLVASFYCISEFVDYKETGNFQQSSYLWLALLFFFLSIKYLIRRK